MYSRLISLLASCASFLPPNIASSEKVRKHISYKELIDATGCRTVMYPVLISAILALAFPRLTPAAVNPKASTETTQISDLEERGRELRNKIDQFYTENKRYCGNGQPLALSNDLLSPYVHAGASFAEMETVLRAAGFHISKPPTDGWKAITGSRMFVVEGVIDPLEQQFVFRSIVLIDLYPENPNEYSNIARVLGNIHCHSL